MGINLDAIQKRLQEMQQTAKGGGNSGNKDLQWKPPVGKSQVRIVPYAFNKDNPFMELYFHYEIGKRTYLSPSSFGRPDPIVEFADKLKRTGDKEDWKLSRKIAPKFRVYAPVIVRGEEAEGVKFWGFGTKIYQDLMGVLVDPDYGDITDLMNGRDITIEHIAADKEGAFPSYSIRVKPNTTPATEDKAIANLIVNEQKEITALFEEPTYEELETALQNWLTPQGKEEGTVKAGSPVSSAPKASKVGDVKGAFESLFGDSESSDVPF